MRQPASPPPWEPCGPWSVLDESPWRFRDQTPDIGILYPYLEVVTEPEAPQDAETDPTP